MSFWAIAVVMLAAAVLPLVYAVVRSQALRRESETAAALYAVRLAELEQDLADGVLPAAAAEAARVEIARSSLAEADTEAAPAAEPASRSWAVAGIVAALVPAISVLTYLEVGDIRFHRPELIAAGGTPEPEQIDQMIVQLEQRLAERPEDGTGWALLGRTYLALGRYGDAVRALRTAATTITDDADLLVQLADALAMANGGRPGPEVAALIDRALGLDPSNINGLIMGGLVARAGGDTTLALERVGAARTAAAAAGMDTTELDQVLEQLGGAVSSVQRSAIEGPGSVTPPAPGVDSPAAIDAAIEVEVTMSPSLETAIEDGGALFVFARDAARPGPPVAVARAAAPEFPFTVTLDASMAVMTGRTLRDGMDVVVGARWSAAANAMPASGDFNATPVAVTIGTHRSVRVVIDDVVE